MMIGQVLDYPILQAAEAEDVVGRYLQAEDLPIVTVRTDGDEVILRNRGRDYTLHVMEKDRYLGVQSNGDPSVFRFGRDEDGDVLFVQGWIRAFAKEGAWTPPG